jgi:hypothetical protein
MPLIEFNFSKLLETLNKQNKERFTFSLDPGIYARFKTICGDVSVSAVIENLMQLSIDSDEHDKLKKTASDTAKDEEKENA